MADPYYLDPSSSRIEPPVTYVSIALNRGVLPKLPYAQHPIYIFRKAAIITAFIGLLLYLPTLGLYYMNEFFAATTLALVASILLCVFDLQTWAHKKAAKPDEDPAWPSKRIMIGDLVMALVLLSVFVGALGEASWRRGYLDPIQATLRDYSYLAMLICSGLHAYAFWKQLMALHKRSWLASLQLPLHVSCQRCGYVLPPQPQVNPPEVATPPRANVQVPAPASEFNAPRAAHRREQQHRYQPVHPQHLHQPPPPQPPNLHTYAGPSATLTPSSHVSDLSHDSSLPGQGDMDDELLIGPGYAESRYQDEPTSAAASVATTRRKTAKADVVSPEPVLEEPAEVVVGKKGGKRREK